MRAHRISLNPDRADRLGNALTLRYQNSNLPQLGDNLFRLWLLLGIAVLLRAKTIALGGSLQRGWISTAPNKRG